MSAIDDLITQLHQNSTTDYTQAFAGQTATFIAALQLIEGAITPFLLPEPANQIFAGPASGPAAIPTFRAMVSADFPINPNFLSQPVPVANTDVFGFIVTGTVVSPAVPTNAPIVAGLRNTYVVTGDGNNWGNPSPGDSLSFYTTAQFAGTNTLSRLKAIEANVSATASGTVNDARAYYSNSGTGNAAATINTLRLFSGDVVSNPGNIGLLIDFYSSDLTAIPNIASKFGYRCDDPNKITQMAGPTNLNGLTTLGANLQSNSGAVQILMAGNAATAPAYSFSFDGTMGMFSQAAGTLAWAIGGARAIALNNSQLFANTASSWQLNTGAAGTGPQMIPNRSNTRAGMGAPVAGGVGWYFDNGTAQTVGARIEVTTGIFSTFFGLTNSSGNIVNSGGQFSGKSGALAGAPSYSFSVDLTTGLYANAAGVIRFAVSGADAMTLNASQPFSNNANGWQFNLSAAGAAPLIIPNRADTKAGLGADAAGDVSLYSDVATVTTEGLRLDTAGDTTIFGNLKTSVAASILRSTLALTDYTGASAGTITNAPHVGNPDKWIAVNDNGTLRKIPTWI